MRFYHTLLPAVVFMVLACSAFCKGGGGSSGSRSRSGCRRRSAQSRRREWCPRHAPCDINGQMYYYDPSNFTYHDHATGSQLPDHTVTAIEAGGWWKNLLICVAVGCPLLLCCGSFNQYRDRLDLRRKLVDEGNPACKVQMHSFPAKWYGSYVEDNKQFPTSYEFNFDWKHKTFSGCGQDRDGRFVVEHGMFSPHTGRFAWDERTKARILYADCFVTLANENAERFDGIYKASSGKIGKLTIHPHTPIQLNRKLARKHYTAGLDAVSTEEPANKKPRIHRISNT